ncbi:MAG TPA: hypothetical protein VGI31_00895, partial [Streptosporangiaceae bacterium]
MSLAGLVSVMTDNPRLRRALDPRADDAAHAGPADSRPGGPAAPAGPGGPGGDLIAPAELRPFLAAALAATGRGAAGEAPGRKSSRKSKSADGRFVLAVTATQREAEDLAAGLGSLLPPAEVAC